jgi:hypothetical protein
MDAIDTPTAAKDCHELGLYDMSGCVGEWVNDYMSDYIYDKSQAVFFINRNIFFFFQETPVLIHLCLMLSTIPLVMILPFFQHLIYFRKYTPP